MGIERGIMNKVRELVKNLFSTDSQSQKDWIYGALLYAWSVGDISESEFDKLKKEFEV